MVFPTGNEYKIFAATDINTMQELIDTHNQEGWFMSHLQVTAHKDRTGYGMQYTILAHRMKAVGDGLHGIDRATNTTDGGDRA